MNVQLLELVGLGRLEESPEVVLGDDVVGMGDFGLFEHAVTVLADEEIRDVLLAG